MPSAAAWFSLPFYVVGEATAGALRKFHEESSRTYLAPLDIRGASDSGTSERLAQFIVEELQTQGEKKLLYLTGDKNRDTLPKLLINGGIQLVSLQVYQTQGSSTFATDLKNTISSTSAGTSQVHLSFDALT